MGTNRSQPQRTSLIYLRDYTTIMPKSSHKDPVPTSTLDSQTHLKLDCSLKRASVSLVPTENFPDRYSLAFCFDSLCQCIVTVYCMAQEVLEQEHTLYFTVDSWVKPPPMSYRFQAGMNQPFPQGLFQVDKQVFKNKHPKVFPFVVTIKPDNPEGLPYQSSFLSLCNVGKGNYGLKLLKQKLHTKNLSYELHEIYGVVNEFDCVFCMENKSCVTCMPCKHLCLCSKCSDFIRANEPRKCPICRTEIKQMVKIKDCK